MNKTNKQKIQKIALVIFIFIFTINISFAYASQITSGTMVELTNGSRSEAGLRMLAVNERLERAAKMKADDMLFNQYFEHTSPEGVTPWFWFEKAGYEYVYAAENLAIDFVTAEGAHKALMESTGHRENILGQNYKEIGIAVVSGEFEGKNTILIVEEFGSQREHKITVNNAAFFETAKEEEIIVEIPVEAMEEETVLPGVKVRTEAEAPIDIAEQIEESEEEMEKTEVVPEDIDAGDAEQEVLEPEGKSIPKIYTVRNIQTPKKVYVEDIHWTNADEGGFISSLGSGASAIKIFLRDLTGGIIYALM